VAEVDAVFTVIARSPGRFPFYPRVAPESGVRRAATRRYPDSSIELPDIRIAARQRWSSRELERQLAGGLFERAVLNPPIVSALLRQLHPEAEAVFRDTYLIEFLIFRSGIRKGTCVRASSTT